MKNLFFCALLFAGGLLVTGCSTTGNPVRTEIVERVVEVQKPCAVEKPARPAPVGPLPTALEAVAAILGAKLKEYTAPGGYADKAEAAIDECITPEG